MPGKTYDCVVIGGGPAGLAAAIYLARFNRSVAVADHGDGRSTQHQTNDNYLGFPDGIAAQDLRSLGERQATRFGAEIIHCKITSVQKRRGVFVATAGESTLRGRTLILAMGVRDRLPQFKNKDARDYFGISLFWCITCDGYRVRGARVVVIGKDDAAATTALQFLNFTPHLSMITNCDAGDIEISAPKRAALRDAKITLYRDHVSRILGEDGQMRAVTLEGGRRIELDYMFNQQGARPNSRLARSLGVKCDGAGFVRIDTEQRTNIPRVYAAGDLTKEFAHQIVTAAHEGATAGQTANYDLYRPEQRE